MRSRFYARHVPRVVAAPGLVIALVGYYLTGEPSAAKYLFNFGVVAALFAIGAFLNRRTVAGILGAVGALVQPIAVLIAWLEGGGRCYSGHDFPSHCGLALLGSLPFAWILGLAALLGALRGPRRKAEGTNDPLLSRSQLAFFLGTTLAVVAASTATSIALRGRTMEEFQQESERRERSYAAYAAEQAGVCVTPPDVFVERLVGGIAWRGSDPLDPHETWEIPVAWHLLGVSRIDAPDEQYLVVLGFTAVVPGGLDSPLWFLDPGQEARWLNEGPLEQDGRLYALDHRAARISSFPALDEGDSPDPNQIMPCYSHALTNPAPFAGAELHDVDLAGSGVFAYWVTTEGMDLTGANLTGAHLQGLDLTQVNLDGACHDSTTVWPEGFTPPPSP